MLKTIIHYHNKLSDKSFIWFPFLFLKPQAHQPITWNLYFKMVPCFALYMTLGLGLRALILNKFSLELITEYLFYSIIGFAAWFALVTRSMWNSRARELQKTKEEG